MRKLVGIAIAAMFFLTPSLDQAEERGKSSGKSSAGRQGEQPNAGKPGAGKPPGGNGSESKQQPQNSHKKAGAEEANKSKSPQNKDAQGAAIADRNAPQASGAEGVAAGYASVSSSFEHPNL